MLIILIVKSIKIDQINPFYLFKFTDVMEKKNRNLKYSACHWSDYWLENRDFEAQQINSQSNAFIDHQIANDSIYSKIVYSFFCILNRVSIKSTLHS